MTDYSSEEFWKGAPEGATHYQPAKHHNQRPVFWRVVGGVAREVWCLYADGTLSNDHFRYGPDGNDCFDAAMSIPRPALPWSGDGLLRVGSTVTLDDEYFPVFDDYRGMIGVPVVVTAAFKSPTGVDMIACALPGGLCGCFRADMARPTKTPAQIAAEEREAAIAEMTERFSLFCHRKIAWGDLFAQMYDSGLRFPKGDDQ